jgi:hypothetical protein
VVGPRELCWTSLALVTDIMSRAPHLHKILCCEISESTQILADAMEMVYARLFQKGGEIESGPLKLTKASYFISLLRCQRKRKCGDPRDRIYSVLALIDQQIRGICNQTTRKP